MKKWLKAKQLRPRLATLLCLLLVGFLLIPLLPVGAHTEQKPYEADLTAGQNTDVGSVFVWNDGTNLYVKFQTTGGWTLEETHVEVEKKTNGPSDPGAPGQFMSTCECDAGHPQLDRMPPHHPSI